MCQSKLRAANYDDKRRSKDHTRLAKQYDGEVRSR